MLVLMAACVAVGAELPRKIPELYATHCAGCHGARLEGGSGGGLRGPWKSGDGSDEHLRRVIMEGLPGRGMPGFGAALDPVRLQGLLIFLREQAAKAVDTAAPRLQEGTVVTSARARFRVETIASGLEIPWSIAFLPDGTALVAERHGQVRPWRDGRLADAIPGTPTAWTKGQGGLFDVVLHPDVARQGWIYLAFAAPGPDPDKAMTKVVRGRWREGRWTDEETIFRPDPAHDRSDGVHFGGRLAFIEGHLLITVGDRGDRGQAQDLARPGGKIHRVTEDGRIPTDNPFVGQANALPTIWSYGHRNPQGLTVRTGPHGPEVWSHDHGPRGGDELNRIERGTNYGWPLVTHGIEYDGRPITAATSRPDCRDPLLVWTPSLAVCGLISVNGGGFPAWRGDLLAGSLAGQRLLRISPQPSGPPTQEVLLEDQGRLRTVQEAPDGSLWLGYERPGRLVRLVPVP